MVRNRRRKSLVRDFISKNGGVIRDYLTAVSGAGGRLVFSLIYFIALANTLTIAEFGIFATASAAGIMLSRVASFGFVSPLYRIATVKRHLIGAYTAGYLLFTLLSLPVLAAAALVTHWIFFSGDVSLPVFATILFTEAIVWRGFEVVLIVNNGMGRFGHSAILAISGTMIRAMGAAALALAAAPDLETWSWYYLTANSLALLLAVVGFYPRQRLRPAWRIYRRRIPDALSVSVAEVLFYLQMELDKLLVLAIGGPHLAGIYAIIMRLVDLTGIPVRTFNMLLVQKLMRTPEWLRSLAARAGIEFGIFAVSFLALLFLAGVLQVYPNALGSNVAEAAPLVILVLLVPGFRNLIEYQAELLYARGQTFVRTVNLTLLAGVKAIFLTQLLVSAMDTADLVFWLNAVFAGLYVISALLTYMAMRLPANRI